MPACGSASDYTLQHHRWRQGKAWYIDFSGRPSNITYDELKEAATSANRTLTAGNAPCDGYRTDQVSINRPYGGGTIAQIDIRVLDGNSAVMGPWTRRTSSASSTPALTTRLPFRA